MQIYIELIFLDNFCMDFILLYGTVRLCKERTVFLKIALSGFIGGVYSILALFWPWLGTLALKIVFSLFMCLPLGVKPPKLLVKRFLFFYLLSFLFSGAMYFMASALGGTLQNGILHLPGFRYILFGLSLGIFLLEFLLHGKFAKPNTQYVLTGTLLGEAFTFPAYVDTGNQLTDFEGKGVIIVNKHLLLAQLSPAMQQRIETNDHTLQIRPFFVQTITGQDTIDGVYVENLVLHEGKKQFALQAYIALFENNNERNALLSPQISITKV